MMSLPFEGHKGYLQESDKLYLEYIWWHAYWSFCFAEYDDWSKIWSVLSSKL